VVVWPAAVGAHSFQPMSFNPDTGLVVYPTMKSGCVLDQLRATMISRTLGMTKRRYFAILGAKIEMGVMGIR